MFVADLLFPPAALSAALAAVGELPPCPGDGVFPGSAIPLTLDSRSLECDGTPDVLLAPGISLLNFPVKMTSYLRNER